MKTVIGCRIGRLLSATAKERLQGLGSFQSGWETFLRATVRAGPALPCKATGVERECADDFRPRTQHYLGACLGPLGLRVEAMAGPYAF
ncbi:hypothetical protein GCM10007170_21380 [Arthrobacter liuii]|uniref:Uncharacterized protein n=1 Tax=Arthrobacter liuii TaxID=1476996 RepID=A0ABQ2ATF6_9MICC|nr:hypothetical protein GCM10007170_21380 [Arthrobacter liuii]